MAQVCGAWLRCGRWRRPVEPGGIRTGTSAPVSLSAPAWLSVPASLAATLLTAFALSGQLPPQTECGPRLHVGETTGTVLFPQGDFFCPLIGDPKEPSTFASLLHGRSPAEDGERGSVGAFDTTVGAIGIGDQFGLFRWTGATPGDGVQIGISAAVFAQFDLDAPSFDLLNADYVVGLPLTMRRGGFSSRLRLSHQSSHLGDEFLMREEQERVNLAFESLQLVLSRAAGPLRLYGGGEYLFNREPADLEEWLAQAGAELRGGLTGGLGLLAAVDVKSSEEQEWKPSWSLRGGLEAGVGTDAEHPPRRWSLLVEFYEGPSPYGQFYREQVRLYGLGIHVSL